MLIENNAPITAIMGGFIEKMLFYRLRLLMWRLRLLMTSLLANRQGAHISYLFATLLGHFGAPFLLPADIQCLEHG